MRVAVGGAGVPGVGVGGGGGGLFGTVYLGYVFWLLLFSAVMTDAGRSFWNGIIDQYYQTIPSLYHQPQTGRPIDLP